MQQKKKKSDHEHFDPTISCTVFHSMPASNICQELVKMGIHIPPALKLKQQTVKDISSLQTQ